MVEKVVNRKAIHKTAYFQYIQELLISGRNVLARINVLAFILMVSCSTSKCLGHGTVPFFSLISPFH